MLCKLLKSDLAKQIYKQMLREYFKIIEVQIQKNYVDAVPIIKKLGFTFSFPNDFATKKDIIKFLSISESTLNSFLCRNKNEIKAIRLKPSEIHAMGSRATKMYVYSPNDVVKIILNMDTVMGIEVKKMLFGNIGSFANIQSKNEIKWEKQVYYPCQWMVFSGVVFIFG